jgi:hypothetical protein
VRTRSSVLALVLVVATAAQAEAPVEVKLEPPPAAPVDGEGPDEDVCAAGATSGMQEGPAALGYFQADLATGRRVCPRTELGLGARFGATIDVPNFYGNLGVNGLLFGSLAVNRRLELFATLEAVNFTYLQTALKQTNLSVGNLTVGGTWLAYRAPRFAGAASLRLLLPTSFEIPHARLVGAELGHTSTWRPLGWLEVHTALGVDFTAAISAGASLPWFGGTLLVGAQLTPLPWFSAVVDLAGHLGPISFLAPTVALRFKVASLGIELAGTLPLAGSDRHDFIAGVRFSWRFD